MEQSEGKRELKDLKIKNRGTCVELLDLTEEDRTRLQERIKKSGGRIFIFVHPYYHETVEEQRDAPLPEELTIEGRKKVWAIEKAIKKVALLPSEQTIPFFIMEEKDRISALKKKISSFIHSQDLNEFYFVPTDVMDPRPVIPRELGERAWERFAILLKSLGVKSILIGGQRLRASWNLFAQPPILRQEHCVAEATKELQSFFDVSLTELSAPHALSTLRGLKKGDIF